jgi:hypothetical protein
MKRDSLIILKNILNKNNMNKFEKVFTLIAKILGLGFGLYILYWGFYFLFFIIKTLINLF